MKKLIIKDKTFNVKLAKTEEELKTGMAFQTFNENFNGMLFMLKNERHCFWMKNCIIPLDIIFIKNKKITKIYHNCQPCIDGNCDNLCGYGDMVLEIAAGTCEKYNITEASKMNI